MTDKAPSKADGLRAMREARAEKNAPKPGRPRIEDRDKTLKATKPWGDQMSERTWRRRQAELRKKILPHKAEAKGKPDG